MKNHHEVEHFKNRLMIVLLSLVALTVMVGQSFAATTCSSCHGMPPLDSADGKRLPGTGAFKGSHQKHVSTPDDPSKCVVCHNSAGYDMKHAATANYKISIAPNITGTGGSYSKGSFFNQTSMPVMGSCSNVSCHADVYSTGYLDTPDWGTTAGCSACHVESAYPITADGPLTGSHAAHSGKACTSCHALGTTASTMPSTGHINGTVEITAGYSPSSVAKHAAGSGYSTCSNVSCHSGNGMFTPAPALWGSTLDCSGCHPNLSVVHDKHIGDLLSANTVTFYNYTANKSTGGIYRFGCANCHPLDKAVKHMNGTVDITLMTSNSGAGGNVPYLRTRNTGAITDATGYTQGANSVTCSLAYCHSNGMASPTFAASPDWFGTFAGDSCAMCHGNSPNTGGKIGSSAHSAHTVAIHASDIFNGVSRKLPIGGGNAVNAAHGRNNRSTTINCNICHAATVGTFANDKNSACSGCHDGSVAPLQGNAAIANTAKHINGSIDVSFINQKIATKAQVSQTAFAAYTAAGSGGWTRNKNIYKTYTSGYDVTKAALSASPSYTTAAGCAVACHSNIPVKWADTVTCTSCHTRLK